MKCLYKLFLYLTLVILCIDCNSQETDFCPLGAKFKILSGDLLDIVNHFEVTKDTLIENKTCRKIVDKPSYSDPTYFVYQDGLKIYEYRDSIFELIFDFGLQIGDSLNNYKIVGIDTIEVEGRLFPRQSIQSIFDTILINGYETEYIIYPIGFQHSRNPSRYIEASLDPVIKWYSLNCYADEWGNTIFNNENISTNCDWAVGNNELNNLSQISWRMIAPCEFYCESDQSIERVNFFSIDGKLLYEITNPSSQFNIPCQYAGLIIGKMYLKNGEKVTEKFYLHFEY